MISRFLRPHALAACIATVLAAAGLPEANATAKDPAAGSVATVKGALASAGGRYIVRFAEPAVAAYNRTLRASQGKSLAAMIPYRLQANGRMHLDTQSNEARTYAATLATQQDQHRRSIESAISRSAPFLRSYRHALNAAVVELTQGEALQVRRLPGVTSVVPDRARAPADDVSTRFIGANSVWLGAAGTDSNPGYTFPTLQSLFGELNTSFGFKGDGIVVGDIDTGYNSLSPSFQATDASGYTITNPLGSGNFLGDCGVAAISLGGCNSKVIGVYDEVSTAYLGRAPVSVEDTQGHGSHTASTAAGNARAASVSGYPAAISGIARMRTWSFSMPARRRRCSARIPQRRRRWTMPSPTASSMSSTIRSAVATGRGTIRFRRRFSGPKMRASSLPRRPATPEPRCPWHCRARSIMSSPGSRAWRRPATRSTRSDFC
jgi:hypothetical protein